jgi:hypothetical protein
MDRFQKYIIATENQVVIMKIKASMQVFYTIITYVVKAVTNRTKQNSW